MKLHRSFSLAALLGITAALSAQTPILPYLPKDTLVAISAPDLRKSLEEFQQMPLAKMYAEPETQKFLADVRELAKKQFDGLLAQGKAMHEKGELPVDPEELLKLQLHGGTVALTSFELKSGDFGPLPKVGVIVHLEFGETAAQWHSLVALGLSMLEGAAGPQLAKSENKVGDWPVRSYLPTDVQGIEMGLHVAMVPNGLLIGTLLDDVTVVAQNLQKKTVGLGGSDEYQAIAKQLQVEGGEVEAFVRMDTPVDILMKALTFGTQMRRELRQVDMAGVERSLQAMGLRQLGTAGMSCKYVDGKAVWRTYHRNAKAVVADAKTATAPKTIDTSFLKWVPKDAVDFQASTLDLLGIYDTMVKGLQAYDPELATKMLAHLADHEKQLGFKFRDDLFGSIGDHYILWSMPVGTITATPEWALLVRVTEEAKLVAALQNLAKVTNGALEIEETEKRGLKTWQVHVNVDPTQGMGGFNVFEMIQPVFAFKNGYMVVGFSAGDVKRVFQRMDREDDPKNDIRSNKEYIAVAGNFPPAVSSIAFTDSKTQFESYYQIATGLLAMVPMGEEVPIDMSLLPDSAALTKHLFGKIGYTKSDAAGTESVTVGPYGAEILSLGVVAIGLVAAVSARNVVASVEDAHTAKAKTDVRMIADAVVAYRMKNGKLPANLEVLATKDDKGRSELEELPKDPWGNDYVLREGERATDWEVISFGPDGSEGTEDDVSSKNKSR